METALSPARMAGLVLVLARIVRDVGYCAGLSVTGTLEGASNWPDDPLAFNRVALAIQTAVEAVRPEGEITWPPAAFMEGSSAELSLRAARWIKADTFAEDLLAAIADEERGGEIGEWARTIREKLGPDLVARIARTQVRVRG